MAVPYHSHKFEIPVASRSDIEAGSRNDVVVTPAGLGSAATRDAGYFATAAQGQAADRAIWSVNGKSGGEIVLSRADFGLDQVDNSADRHKPLSLAAERALGDKANSRDLGSAAYRQAGSFASAEAGQLAASAVQPGDAALLPAGGVAGQVLARLGDGERRCGWVNVASATAVSYGPQQLSQAQQSTARANIGAVGSTVLQAALQQKAAVTDPQFSGLLTCHGAVVIQAAAGEAAPQCRLEPVGGLAGVGQTGARLGVTAGDKRAQFDFSATGDLTVPAAIRAAAVWATAFVVRVDGHGDATATPLAMQPTLAMRAALEFWGTARLVNGRAEIDIERASGLAVGSLAGLAQNAVALAPNNLDGFAPVRAGPVNGGRFSLYCSDPDCNDLVSWSVKAERVVVE